jgi:hypothetical protein
MAYEAIPVTAAAVAHVRMLKATAGVPVLYGRGGASYQLTAVPGRTANASEGAFGIVLENSTQVDWIIEAADLEMTPLRGDTITRLGTVYDVLPGPSGRVADPFDPYGVGLRIHSKLTELPT